MEQRSDDGTNSIASTSGGHVAVEMSIIEELDLRFGSAKNKNQIIHSLEHCAVLHRIPLQNPNATSEQARKDFRRERVLLNDVPFIPDNIDVDRCNAFDKTLSIYVERMMRRKELYDHDLYGTTEAVVDAVLQRACRTSAGADSFFMVQKLLCVEGTFVTQRTYVTDPPIKIDVFEADAEVEGEYLTASSRKLPSLPSRSGHHSSNSSYSGIAMDRADQLSSGQRTPPSTPPLGSHGHGHGHAPTTGKSKRSLPSPLKISLKNMGFVKSSASKQPPQPLAMNHNVGGGSESSSPAFTPPSTPQPLSHTHHSNHHSSGGPEDFALHSTPSSHSKQTSTTTTNTNSLCCRIQVMNSFAIYDVASIELITGVASQDPDPWLEVEAIVVDESNFKTDRHWRKLQLIATCPATGKVYTSTHDASSSTRHSGRLSGRMILQELTSWLRHSHHDKHHHKHKEREGKDVHANNSNNNHYHGGTNTATDQPSPVVSVQDVPLHIHTTHAPSTTPQHNTQHTSHTLHSLHTDSLSPGLSPSISPMSTSTNNMQDLSMNLMESSFVSVSSTADATNNTKNTNNSHTNQSEFSPIDAPLTNYSTHTHNTNNPHHTNTTHHTNSSALSLQHDAALHAAALASLQQEIDTPNSAPHSLKYSTNPSPASPLKGLNVASTDAADGHENEDEHELYTPAHQYTTSTTNTTHHTLNTHNTHSTHTTHTTHYATDRYTEIQERPTDLLTSSSFATDRTSGETRDSSVHSVGGVYGGSSGSSSGVYGTSSSNGVYGSGSSSSNDVYTGSGSSSTGGMSVVNTIIGSGVYGVRRGSATGFGSGSPSNLTRNLNAINNTNNTQNSSIKPATNTTHPNNHHTNNNHTTTGNPNSKYTSNHTTTSNNTHPIHLPLPVRTHEDLDLLIPALRLLHEPRGSAYSSDTSSTGEGEGVWHDKDSETHSPAGSNTNSVSNSASNSAGNSANTSASSSLQDHVSLAGSMALTDSSSIE